MTSPYYPKSVNKFYIVYLRFALINCIISVLFIFSRRAFYIYFDASCLKGRGGLRVSTSQQDNGEVLGASRAIFGNYPAKNSRENISKASEFISWAADEAFFFILEKQHSEV